MISSSIVQEIKVTPIDQIIKPNDMLKSFPGPLGSAKLKKGFNQMDGNHY